MKNVKNVLLTILITIIFFGGAYLIGGYVLETFNGGIVTQLYHTVFGILCWCVIFIVFLFIVKVYDFVSK